MALTPTLYRRLRLANAVLFAVALALALDHSVAAALGRYDGGHHWASGRRELVVVDRTGDPAWHQATRQAVAAWSEAAAGTDLRLRWEAGRGPCRPGGPAIAVCLGLQRALGDADHDDRQGVARVLLSRGHTESAVIQVCRDCGLDAARRRVVAAHEVGHALGLAHSDRARSVMHALGGTDRPDAGDAAELRSRYDHRDSGRCGLLGVGVGALCF